jgi:hypothetical protein
LAGRHGFEPRLTESESAVLPFRAHEKPGREDRGAPPKTRGRAPRRNGHILLLRLTLRKGDTLRFHYDPSVPFTNNAEMMRSQQDLVQIVANGGGLDMKVGPRNQQDLVQLAANAGRSGAKFVLRDVGMRPTTDLVQIAANGAGNVVFVFDD